MKSRHGLTLVEVLAATVLLTMIATAAMPLFERAWRHLHDASLDTSSLDVTELGSLADDLIENPAQFGFEAPPVDDAIIAWPQHPERESVEIAIAPSEPAAARYVWLRFRCEELIVLRRIRLPDDAAKSGGRR